MGSGGARGGLMGVLLKVAPGKLLGRVRFIPNVHIYKNGHNWGRKWVSRHDSGAIRREI